jgi:hypothetical protein
MNGGDFHAAKIAAAGTTGANLIPRFGSGVPLRCQSEVLDYLL